MIILSIKLLLIIGFFLITIVSCYLFIYHFVSSRVSHLYYSSGPIHLNILLKCEYFVLLILKPSHHIGILCCFYFPLFCIYIFIMLIMNSNLTKHIPTMPSAQRIAEQKSATGRTTVICITINRARWKVFLKNMTVKNTN